MDNLDDWVIAVRTYKRAILFKQMTYATLLENNLCDRLYIFVANEEEYQIYKKELEGCLYKELVIGVLGGLNVKKFMTEYFPVGKRIVFMDDDKPYFYHFENDPKKKLIKHSTCLRLIIEDGFKTIEENGYGAFSVNFSTNRLYLWGKPYKEFKKGFLHGSFFGCRNDPSFIVPEEDLAYPTADDTCFTIRNYDRYGGVLLYNWCGFPQLELLDGGFQASGERGTNETRDEFTKKKWQELYDTNKLLQLYTVGLVYNKAGLYWCCRLKTATQIKKIFKKRKILLRWKGFPEWLTPTPPSVRQEGE